MNPTPRGVGTVLVLAMLVPSCNSGASSPTSPSGPARSSPMASVAQPPGATLPDPAVFSSSRAFGHVRELAGRIGPRSAGSFGYRKAARYVLDRFVELGYRARLVPFELPNGSTSRNVVATWPSPARSRILIGAHLDTVPGSPGANDNASGVAVILELARVFAGTHEARGIRFVAFGAEEVQQGGGHHFGSAAYSEGARPRAMVSVDMIGLDRTIIVGWMGIGSRKTVAALLSAAKESGVDAREKLLPDWSDNGPFERAGVPSALLWTGDEPNHHQPTDVVAKVRRAALLAAGTLVMTYVTQQLVL
ncbi:MAG TPA: M28 family peptidase [Actinomycetota bacterium]|nr:M28 family peptidase [Actinomycetota bacterium]